MINPFNLYCNIVDRKENFNIFNFEKLFSGNVTVTGIINNILYGKQFINYYKKNVLNTNLKNQNSNLMEI